MGNQMCMSDNTAMRGPEFDYDFDRQVSLRANKLFIFL